MEEFAHPLDLARILRETFVADAEHWQSIDSTNNRGKELVGRPGLPLPFLIVAEHQTAGRGRGHRRWWTGTGSLAFSLLLSPALTPSRHKSLVNVENHGASSSEPGPSATGPLASLAMVGLAGALAVCRAARPFVPPGIDLGLYWPNDVCVIGRKLAGVLVEVAASSHTIMGVGVNVNNRASEAPESLRKQAISLYDLCGTPLDRTDVLIAILREIERLLGDLAKSPGRVAREADTLCLQKGRVLTVENEKHVYHGICRGIDPSGALLLETPEGLRRLISGTVVNAWGSPQSDRGSSGL